MASFPLPGSIVFKQSQVFWTLPGNVVAVRKQSLLNVRIIPGIRRAIKPYTIKNIYKDRLNSGFNNILSARLVFEELKIPCLNK